MPRLEQAGATPGSLPSDIRLGSHSLRPHPYGALYWDAERTLIVADLHLEKGAVSAARGALLPPYDTRATLQRLALLIEAFQPRRIAALGDSFHTSRSAAELAGEDRAMLACLQKGREWYWISGNHDPDLPPSVGGVICTALTISGVTLRHEPKPELPSAEIAGHLHPCARIVQRGTALRRKCFATDGRRLVMPAFGAYTGGLNVLDKAFGALFRSHDLMAWLMGKRAVYAIAGAALIPD
jgi:DNA ligase-associated metallophosphoesterase